MFKDSPARCAAVVVLSLISLVSLVLAPVTAAQLQDHDPCGNTDPDEAPAVTCGEFCGFETETDANGNPVVKMVCQEQPISNPGYTWCKIETHEDGTVECKVSFVTKHCQVA